MRARGYDNRAVGTILLAQARLEDEDGFFATVHEGGEDLESSPWYLLGRTLLLYKLGRRKNARRAARDFAQRCDGGAFFLLNPTYLTPYLPTRPEPQEPWNLTHQAVWEADSIIVEIPRFSRLDSVNRRYGRAFRRVRSPSRILRSSSRGHHARPNNSPGRKRHVCYILPGLFLRSVSL